MRFIEKAAMAVSPDGRWLGRNVAIGSPTVREKSVVFLGGINPNERTKPTGNEASPRLWRRKIKRQCPT
jgi:hypothetical protein